MPNSISEWFGHRVFPTVASTPATITDQREERCPFLTAALGSSRKCIKAANSKGVCTVSSELDGLQMDWVVCPYRTLESPLLEDAVRRLYGFSPRARIHLTPAPALAEASLQEKLLADIRNHEPTLVYFMDKLGGEIDLPVSRRSPKFKLDTTVVELLPDKNGVTIGRHAIVEVQTMDYHGTYAAATQSLTNALKLHPREFATQLERNPGWASAGIEGPNIANVFKRTIYQVLLKFQLVDHADCAGCVLTLPESVWLSWQPHLGAPELLRARDGVFEFTGDIAATDPSGKGWIQIFDSDIKGRETPNPLRITKTIRASSRQLARLAFEKAPAEAMALLTDGNLLRATLQRRIAAFWPALWPSVPRTRRKGRG
jgi:hypothetical protein